MRCLYVDLDGTLLGPNASLLRGGDGRFSAMAVRALEACCRADVEVVLFSGRKQSSVFETSRLIGADSYIFELGCGLVLDGELEWLTDGVVPSPEHGSIFDQISATGAPEALLAHFGGRLEYHTPWSVGREVSHLFRGAVDLDEARAGAGCGRGRLAASGRQRRRAPPRRTDAGAADHSRVPPDSRGRIEGACGRPAHAGARLCSDRTASPRATRVRTWTRRAWSRRSGWSRMRLSATPPWRRSSLGRPGIRIAEEGYGAGVYEAVVTTLAGG